MEMSFAMTVFTVMAQVLVWLLGLGILAVIVLYFIDRNQTEHTVLRNYPVIGRFRYWFEHPESLRYRPFRGRLANRTWQSSAARFPVRKVAGSESERFLCRSCVDRRPR